MDAFSPFVIAAIVDGISNGKNANRSLVMFGILRLVTSKAGLQGLQRVLRTRISYSLHQMFKAFCYGHVMDLSADFHFSKPVGQRITAISWGGSLIDSWLELPFTLLPLIMDLMTALIGVTLMFPSIITGSLVATMLCIAALNAFGAVQKVVQKREATNLGRRQQELHIMNTLLCWRTVSECRKIGAEKQRHLALSGTYRALRQEAEDVEMQLEAQQEVTAVLGFFVACSYLLQHGLGHKSAAQILTLYMYWNRTTDAVRRVGNIYTRFLNETRNTSLLRSVLDTQPSINHGFDRPAFSFKGGEVVFDNVSFSYDGRRDVINNLSLTASPGQKVALVGQSGSGKSTIFRLLCRHFDPTRGKVTVDGQDLRDVFLDSYRAVLGIVSQNAVLLNASIKQNVAYPTDASDELVVAACQAAEIHDTIMQLPNQYDQDVEGLELSGGEIQRLVLARLYVQNPKIVLLDEVTSNLDGLLEQRTWALLNSFCRGRTTLIITHRLSTIRDVDKIVVIQDGGKVEEGTHGELIGKRGSLYAASLKAQNDVEVWS